MKLWDFGRVKDGKVRIGDKVRRRLGLEDGSQVYSTLFRYEQDGSRGHEIVLSTFGPENYRELCNLTFYMIDSPGACSQAAKFLADRNVDILNSVSVSMTCGISMVWKMLVDLSYYGDSTQLVEDFAALRRRSPAALSKVESMEISHSHISDRYTKGMTGPQPSKIKVKPLRSLGDGEVEGRVATTFVRVKTWLTGPTLGEARHDRQPTRPGPAAGHRVTRSTWNRSTPGRAEPGRR